MSVALNADCESPCVSCKPAGFRSGLAGIRGTGCIAIAEHVKRVASRVSEGVLVWLNGERRLCYREAAVFAPNTYLFLRVSGFIDFDRNMLAHSMMVSSK